MTALFLLVLAAAVDSTPAERLAALADRVWAHQVADDGLARLRHGLPVERLPDFSEAGATAEARFWKGIQRDAASVPDRALTDDQRVTKEIIGWLADRGVEAEPFYWFPSLITAYASPIRGLDNLFAALPVKTAPDRARYLRLASEYAGVVRTLRGKVEGQVARRLVIPVPAVQVTIPLWRTYLQPPRQHPLWVKPNRLAEVDSASRRSFETALEAVLAKEIEPALRQMVAYLEGPYLAAAPAQVGLWQYQRGSDYYRYLVRVHTTTSITPDELFRIGERQIDSLRRELDGIRRAVGFSGDLAAFQTSLRTDPRFFVKTPEAVGQRLDGFAALMEPKLDSLFGRRPKAPYGVARLAPELEPTMTYGYYSPPTPAEPKGIYYYNGSKLEQRNLAMAEGLTYHELAPGHHFQIMLQRENHALPRLRQELYFTAHGEGWGDYSSMLGADAGLYRDPYSRAGRLMMEMMLGTRLVLDVGIHHHRWTLERARQFMKENTLETETQIGSETLRYGVDIPGQALAYRMGSLTIRRIREDAKRALGRKWDVRKFHDLVLSSGPMPLDVLQRRVERFVATEK
jgi:uncharacterized protein (DUF885 family)